jgi:putative transposase
MMKNHKLAGAIGDASFNEIKRQLTYKTFWYGGSIIEVDRFFPSSKMCSVCGCLKKDLKLENRIYICDCGNVIDRDLNASINLEKYGLIKLKDTDSLSGIQACGESARPIQVSLIEEAVSAKQEENIKFSLC